MTLLFAFLHHVLAFVLVAALAIELVLVKDRISIERARRILRADAIYGASAMLLLIVGFLRVIFFEKGAAYYFHSIPFVAKLLLFAAVGVLSIYPTMTFLSWRKSLNRGREPVLDPAVIKRIRKLIHYELVCLVLIVLAAAMMARGVGYWG
ncbi:MAG: DUF2214 family protein [Advenella sp.]|uniref:DUF2214 domain-containing protein n=1 Tax=Advenella kashmirensis TaxID=310575 RepID=A0A356LG83_9BURK|nr:DUF2214 family protein [Advenella sp. FME57]HBP30033.1 DUF2214 domain-containing protein [Advenella kashmirensis]